MSNELTPSISKIMIIRHAEKPSHKHQGIKIKGRHDSKSLVVKGWVRAGALVALFSPFNSIFQNSKLSTPNILYASSFRKKGNGKSERSLETIIPLSEQLKVEINAKYSNDDFTEMIEDVMMQSGTALICWHHKHIPHIANHILAEKISPQSWPNHRFDIVWVFDQDTSTGKYTFSQVPQNLLAGDINKPIT